MTGKITRNDYWSADSVDGLAVAQKVLSKNLPVLEKVLICGEKGQR